MNFYASSEYLQLVAEIYFPGRPTRVADVAVEDHVLRVLIVDEREAATEVPFLDYHQPLRIDETGNPEKRGIYVSSVARSVVAVENRHEVAPGFVVSPYADWSGFATADVYFEALKRQHAVTVRQLHRLRRRLEEDHGPLEFTPNDRRDDVIAFALRWKSEQFRDTGLPDLFADRRNVRFFTALRQQDLLVASTLRIGGRLLSAWLGFIHDNVWSGWIFTYDRAWSRYSPGHQLMQSMLRHSLSSGHREFDFSVGGQDYKWLYATHARVLGSLGRRPPTGAREIAVEALRRAHLLDMARSLRSGARRITGH
jgi:hypothetical protein